MVHGRGGSTDAYVDQRLAEAKAPDANDAMYQWNARLPSECRSRQDRGGAAGDQLRGRRAQPPELDTLEKGMAAIGHGEVLHHPGERGARGHGTKGSQAALYADRLAAFLAGVPKM